MTTIAIRLQDEIINNLDINARTLHLSRTAYIKQAIIEMNNTLQKNKRTERLISASLRVREESMRINHEFSAIEYAPEA